MLKLAKIADIIYVADRCRKNERRIFHWERETAMSKLYISSGDFKCIAHGEDIIEVVSTELFKMLNWPAHQENPMTFHLADFIRISEKGYADAIVHDDENSKKKNLLSETDRQYTKREGITLIIKHFKRGDKGIPWRVIFIRTIKILDKIGYTTIESVHQ